MKELGRMRDKIREWDWKGENWNDEKEEKRMRTRRGEHPRDITENLEKIIRATTPISTSDLPKLDQITSLQSH